MHSATNAEEAGIDYDYYMDRQLQWFNISVVLLDSALLLDFTIQYVTKQQNSTRDILRQL